MTEQHWIVIYREGYPMRCRWRKVDTSFGDRDDAEDAAASLEHSGQRTLIRTAQEQRICGFPIGWTLDHWRAQIDTHEISKDGWWHVKPVGEDPLGDYHGRNE